MADQIERLPASPDRDRLLSEVRSRVVDVDTGVTPRSMLPLREPVPEPEPVLPRPAKRERAKVIKRVAPWAPVRAPEAARPAGVPEQWPVPRGHLSLEDTPQPHNLMSHDRAVPPWARGLRG